MAFSMTHKYIPRIEQREENLFMEEYYSSTDTKIYMDDIEQTEIGYINYSLQEQLKPLYGYASRTFDDVSVGNRIVTGMFKVPVKNPEMQTQPEDIGKYISGDISGTSVEKYDKEEEEELKKKDWVYPFRHPPVADGEDTGTGSTWAPVTDTVLKDPVTFEYIEKIMSLPGTTVTVSGYAGNAKAIISAFQAENGIQASGTLTEETKHKIDEMVMLKTGKGTFILPAGTRIYTGPGTVYPYITTSAPQGATQIGTVTDAWAYITTESRQYGYIERGGA